MKADPQKLRAEASRAVEAISERHFTPDALERSIKTFAGYIYDLTDDLAVYEKVAHAAWHLLDDGGEADSADDNGVFDVLCSGLDAKRLSDELDALEAIGWDAHPDASEQRNNDG